MRGYDCVAGDSVTPPVTLRPYQVEQVEAVERFHQMHQVRSVLVEAATGVGKTTSAAELARRAVSRGETVLFLAHRRELIDQAAARFESFGLQVGIERGSRVAGAESVVCASVQTMRGERLAKFPRDAFDLIIYDECHHSVAPGGRAILDHFHTANVVGVTATSDRADGIPMSTVYANVAHRYGIAEAIAGGYLVPVKGIHIDVPGMDLSKVRQRRQMVDGSVERPGETVDLLAPAGQARIAPEGGKRYSVDLHPGDLSRAVLDPMAVEGVVVPLLALAGNRRTVVFAVDRKHAAAIAASLNEKRPDCARVVHGAMKVRDRKATLAAHQAGEYQFLVNVLILAEGYDDPAIECVAMARPTQSRVLYSQAVGRALRLFAGKTLALLLDFVGVGSKFDLVGPEDALAGALEGPVERYVPPAQPETFAEAYNKRMRAALGVPSKTTSPVTAPAPFNPTNVRFTTRVVELVRGAGRAAGRAVVRAGGWFSRFFGFDEPPSPRRGKKGRKR